MGWWKGHLSFASRGRTAGLARSFHSTPVVSAARNFRYFLSNLRTPDFYTYVTMGFDVKTDKGLKDFNTHLEDKSYVNGYMPSQSDADTFNTMSKAPAANLQNALRWYNHIKSFSADERKKFAAGGACPMKTAKTTTAPPAKNDDDDVDLFGSDDEEEDAEAARIREERLKAYADKKSKKPALIAKSSVLLDVKPWDDETDMKKMEESVRTIVAEGLVWGASKLVPVGYGINKLQIMCVIEDSVSVDLITEQIEAFEDFVQSVDIAAFNKI